MSIFWFTRVNDIRTFEIVFAVTALIVSGCILMYWGISRSIEQYQDSKKKEDRQWSKPFYWTLIISVIFWILYSFTPSKRDIAIIMYSNKETPKEIRDLIKMETDSSTIELKEENTKK